MIFLSDKFVANACDGNIKAVIDERNIEDEERRFPRSIEKEDVNEEKEVVTDAMKSEELVETEESESL